MTFLGRLVAIILAFLAVGLVAFVGIACAFIEKGDGTGHDLKS